ncbi:MAG: hypothetical protein WKG00_03810 [Polyangiaceae bacterium]
MRWSAEHGCPCSESPAGAPPPWCRRTPTSLCALVTVALTACSAAPAPHDNPSNPGSGSNGAGAAATSGDGGSGNTGNDNPTGGAMLVNHGELPYSEVFGLAFWAGRAYGFSAGGDLFEVTLDAGGATTTPITFPDPPPGLEFWGAGSTTIAPPEEVPN